MEIETSLSLERCYCYSAYSKENNRNLWHTQGLLWGFHMLKLTTFSLPSLFMPFGTQE